VRRCSLEFESARSPDEDNALSSKEDRVTGTCGEKFGEVWTCLKRGADLPLTVSCFSKIQIGSWLLRCRVAGSSNTTSQPLLCNTHTHTHTHLFNCPLSGTTRLSRYQRGKTNLDFTEAKDSEWQWHPLCHASLHLAPVR